MAEIINKELSDYQKSLIEEIKLSNRRLSCAFL